MIRPALSPAELLIQAEPLSRLERAQIRFIRHTFDSKPLDRAIRTLQRSFGSTWIHQFTKHLSHFHGIDRLPALDPTQSYILVSNHRSFFDLYVVTAEFVRRRLAHRIVFPVRANFFYDSVSGFFVNGIMSFFAMYPPVFRDRSKAALNLLSINELSALLRSGGFFAGVHPEGTRNLGPDPYTLLPGQPGVGRIIHGSRATVLPVFVNGLINDLKRQVLSNFDGTGTPIISVFGKPIDFDDLLDKPGSPRVYRAISERCLEQIAALGAEERTLRASLRAEPRTAEL